MENEKNGINREKNEFNYIKNLCYDMDTGKITIKDSENKIYKSDIFGRKTPKFLPHITGLKNRYNKNELEQKNLFRQKRALNLKSISTNESLDNNANINISRNNKGYTSYTPIIRKFEGYSKFPRPRGPPLLNIPDYELKEKQKRNIIEQLNNYYSEDSSVKNDIIRKNENKGLSYLTKNLNEYDIIKYDFNKLQKLVKNNLDEIKLRYQMKENMFKKDNVVKALSQFNKNISENKNSKTINGRILQEPQDIMKKYYKIINKVIKHKKNSTHEKNNLKKFNLKLIMDNINNKNTPKDINEYTQTEMKDFTLGRIIKLDFGKSPEIKTEQTEPELNNNNQENKNEEINIEINDTTNNEINENNNNNNNDKEKNDEINVGEKSESINNILEEKIKNNNISFISELSDNGKKYFKKNNLNIKTINGINTNTEHDNKLLEGYMEKPVEELKIFQKAKVIRLKTEGDLYLDNLKLLKKTNKTAFLLREKKELYDLKLLKKKIQNQTININNAMKIKKIPNRKKDIIKTE